jgi:hypothetical protein
MSRLRHSLPQEVALAIPDNVQAMFSSTLVVVMTVTWQQKRSQCHPRHPPAFSYGAGSPVMHYLIRLG